MEYKVKLTDQFLDEFEEICDYISNKLKNIDASNRLREKVIYNILLLENSPRMCTEIEKAIKNGTVYKENTTIYDKYSNPVKVPAGFRLASDSGTDVTKGIVIEDAEAGDEISKGNQYVWVPLGDIKYNENGDIKTINLGRYSFDAIYNEDTQQVEGAGEATLQQLADDYTSVVEIDVEQYYNYTELTNSSNGVEVAKNLEDFITKAKTSEGYYIGRFEAGKVEENTNTFNIKKGQEVYNEVTQANAANLARNLYNNSNFESDLINSYAWDTAIVFIQTFSGDTDYSKQSGLQLALTTTGNAHDNSNNYDIRCNIYDMAGNVREWSTEIYTNSNSPCVYRGGSYGGNSYYTAYRTPNNTNFSYASLGFRTILYVK